MLQIIPVVKQQMNSTCSTQVLHYIQQLTTSLTRLQQLQSLPQGTASPRYAEFSQFFHRQLDSTLRDSLAKFEGRKYGFFCCLLCGDAIVLPVNRRLLSYNVYVEVAREDYQNCSMLCYVQELCTIIHMYMSYICMSILDKTLAGKNVTEMYV